ncbi:MAG: hypothetical protein WDA07_14745 [Leucobacter sp.]
MPNKDLDRNREGFLLSIDGQWISTSYVSALSGRVVGTDGVTEPVAGVPGVSARYTPSEYAQLTMDQRAAVKERALAFARRWQPVPPAPDDTQELDALDESEE